MSQALEQSPTQQARANVPLGPLDYAALNYFLQGRTMRSIAEELGIGAQRLNNLLNRPSVKSLFEAVKSNQKQMLEMGAESAVATLRDLMVHQDAHVRLSALDKWFKVMGWYSDKLKVQFTMGAEEIAAALMQSAPNLPPTQQEVDVDSLVREFTEDD